jgi:hypothetical protein
MFVEHTADFPLQKGPQPAVALAYIRNKARIKVMGPMGWIAATTSPRAKETISN